MISTVPVVNLTSSIPAVRECVTRWSHCSSSSLWNPRILCPTSGHLSHPHNSSLYLRCRGPGYAACVCSCRYTGMCFDQDTHRCVFPDTFPDTSCQVMTSSSPQKLVNKPEANISGNDILKNTKPFLNNVNSNNNISGHGNTSVTGSGIQAGELYSYQPEAVRQVTDMDNLILEDHSLIPAWAMALLACCGVIVAMLIVLLLYWYYNAVYMSLSQCLVKRSDTLRTSLLLMIDIPHTQVYLWADWYKNLTAGNMMFWSKCWVNSSAMSQFVPLVTN